jgi:hypothetical protein
MKKKPLLSIILAARNDNYTNSFSDRFSFILNYNAYLIKKYSPPGAVEILISDMNSDIPLREVLVVKKDFNEIISFLEFKSPFDSTSGKNTTDFHVTLAINVALRRSKGIFSLVMGSDQFFSPFSFKCLQSYLLYQAKRSDSPVYGLVPRRQLPNSFKTANITFEEMDNYISIINSSQFKYSSQKINSGAGVGGLLFKSNSYRDLGGFSESWAGYGYSDSEFMGRVSCHHSHVDCSNFGIYLYKLPRTSGGSRLKRISEKNLPLEYFNPEKYEMASCWGLGKSLIHRSQMLTENLWVDDSNYINSENGFVNADFAYSEINLKRIIDFSRILAFQALFDKRSRVSISDITELIYIYKLICFSNIKTIWIDVDRSFKYLPFLVSQFPDLSIIIFDPPVEEGNFDREMRSGRIIRLCYELGHYGNMRGVTIVADKKAFRYSLLQNKVFELLWIFDSSSDISNSIRADLLLTREISVFLYKGNKDFINNSECILESIKLSYDSWICFRDGFKKAKNIDFYSNIRQSVLFILYLASTFPRIVILVSALIRIIINFRRWYITHLILFTKNIKSKW